MRAPSPARRTPATGGSIGHGAIRARACSSCWRPGAAAAPRRATPGLLLGLDRSRYEVRALSLSAGSAVQRVRALGVPVEVLDEADDERAVRELADWLRREEIDLVHAHMFRAEVIGTRAAVAAGTAVIVATVHSSRVRCSGGRRRCWRPSPRRWIG